MHCKSFLSSSTLTLNPGDPLDSVPVHRRWNVQSDELLHVRQLGLVRLRRCRSRLLALYEERFTTTDENKLDRPVLFYRSLPAPSWFQVKLLRVTV